MAAQRFPGVAGLKALNYPSDSAILVNRTFISHDQMLTNTPKQTHDSPPKTETDDIRDRIRAIIGADSDKLACSLTGDASRETWRRHLEEKYRNDR